MATGETKNARRWWLLAALTALLLFTAWLRMRHIVTFIEWPDELRTLWRTQGTLDELIMRTPGDWPITYGLVTWGWTRVVGPTLEMVRLLSVLAGVLGAALTYRAARALINHPWRSERAALAGLAAVAAYAVLGHAIFAGANARAYGMLLAAGPLAVWLVLRWARQPTGRRTVAAALGCAIPLYLSYTSVPFIGLMWAMALALRRDVRQRWLGLVVLTSVMALPLAPGFVANAGQRVAGVAPQPTPPFGEAMVTMYRQFGGSDVFLGVAATTALLVILVAARERARRTAAALLALWVLAPIGVYVVINNREFLEARYLWWVTTGLTLVIGWASAGLPRRAQGLAVAGLVILAAAPVDFGAHRLAVTSSPPFRATFNWLAERLRPDDVIVIDPNCTCGEAYGWDIFVRQYFPTGYLPIVEEPGDTRRVWYLSTSGWERDEALLAEVEAGRRAAEFFGPWYFLLQLYEGAPAPGGAVFGGKVALDGVEVARNDTILARGDTLTVRLWWSAVAPLDADYSFSAAILDWRGRLIAQNDAAPNAEDTPPNTSAWQPNTTYTDTRTISLPANLPDGDYHLAITVYQWWDGARLEPETTVYPLTGEDDDYVRTAELIVAS